MTIRSRPIAVGLTLAAAGVVASHLFRYWYFNYTSHPVAYRLVDRFNLDAEGTVAVWFASLLLLFCGAATAMLAYRLHRRGVRGAWRWWVIAGLLMAMSIDETASFHELLGALVDQDDQYTGYFGYAWVVVAIPLVALGFAVLGPALFALPRWISWRLLAAAALYVGGAVGMEMLGSKLVEEHGAHSGAYFIAVTAEESLELAGLVLGLYSIMLGLTWSLRPATEADSATALDRVRPDAPPPLLTDGA